MVRTRSYTSRYTHDEMIILVFNTRRAIVPRPMSYKAAVSSACGHFQEISPSSTVRFLSDELDICQGQLAEVSAESWEHVVDRVKSLTINISSREVPEPPTTLVPQSERRIRIKIRDLCGKYFELKVRPTALVQHLTDVCRDKWGVDNYSMYYSGEMLSRDKRVFETRIEDGAVIYAKLVPVLRGGKPVIYLFSPEEIEASVSLSLVPEWKLSAIYPVIPVKTTVSGQGQMVVWRVQTKTNGELTELNTGLDVSYLFWEAHTETVVSVPSPPASPAFDESASAILEHFNPATPNLAVSNSVVVPAEKITPYLDKALNALGLHTEARTSFITYWLPSFLKHKHIALRFLPQAAYERAAPLDVYPKPDITTRIFMLFKGIEDDVLPYWKDAMERSSQAVQFWVSIVGVDVERTTDSSLFRVVEWGGMEVLGDTELGIDG